MSLKLAPDLYTKPPVNATGGMRADRRSIELTAADLESNTQIIGLVPLPAGHRLVDFNVESDALDSDNAMTATFGILNTYYNQPAATVAVPAAYNSGGATNTDTAPALVTGQNILTTITGLRAGGRSAQATLAFCDAIGVDHNKDRIIAVQFPTAATSADAGTLTVIPVFERA